MATYNGHNEDSSGNILLGIGNGMTATVETGSTASQAYTKGALLFFNNRLCKATKAISSGATLAVGTNLSQTSLGAELTSHLRSSDGKEFYFDVKDGTYGYYPSASKVSSEFVPFGGTDLDNGEVLWTNTNSLSSFSPQTVTLSKSMASYKYIGVEYIYESAYASFLRHVYLKYDDFVWGGVSIGTTIGNSISDYSFRGRSLKYNNDTSVAFGNTYSSGSVHNNLIIPTKIIGIK